MIKYQTFWYRLFATIIDAIVLAPFAFLINLIPLETEKQSFVFVQVASSLLLLAYFVIGNGKYGYTVGKRIMKVKILALDEKNLIGYKWAFLRESVGFLFSVALIVYVIIYSKNETDIESGTMKEFTSVSNYITGSWVALEFITMLLNKKRRAVHDFIARSVVVRTEVE